MNEPLRIAPVPTTPADPSGVVVDWILSGDRSKASSRLQGYLIHEWLRRQGVRSTLAAVNFNAIDSAYDKDFMAVAANLYASPAQVVVFEAPEWTMVTLARLCARWNKRVVAVRCDRIQGSYDTYFDLTILPTEGLRSELGVARGAIIEDVIEVPRTTCKTGYSSTGKLKVVWVGHGSYAEFITDFISQLQLRPGIAAAFAFELISAGSFATRQWSETTVVQDVLACDIAIIPIPHGEWFANKSSNRLAMMFALGMPTIATPIASYEAIAEEGRNVLFARSVDDFATQLLAFASESRRAEVGARARASLGSGFDIDSIGPRWLKALSAVEPAAPVQGRRGFGLAALDGVVRALAPLMKASGHVRGG